MTEGERNNRFIRSICHLRLLYACRSNRQIRCNVVVGDGILVIRRGPKPYAVLWCRRAGKCRLKPSSYLWPLPAGIARSATSKLHWANKRNVGIGGEIPHIQGSEKVGREGVFIL